MNRREALRTLGAGGAAGLATAGVVVAAGPVVAVQDPLTALIIEYRRQLEIYDAGAGWTNDECQAMAAITFNPSFDRLRHECPMPTTMDGAIEGVRLVRDELREGCQDGLEDAVLSAVLAFFDGGRAS